MSGTMGGVDSSIALQARPPAAPNPLQQIGEFANASNALNQLKLFPGQQQLQQQAITTGGVNQEKLINQAVHQGLTPLLGTPPPNQDGTGGITHQAVTSAIAGLEARHLPTYGVIADLARMPKGDGPEFDAAWRALNASQAMTSPESSVGAVVPNTTLQSNGQAIVPLNIAPSGSQTPGAITTPGGSLPVFPSTGQLMGQVTWQDGQGVTHYGTAAEYANARGIPGAALGPAVAVPQSGGMGNGRYPAPAAPLANTTGPEPGVSESKVAQVPTAQATADRVAHFQTDMFPLQQAQIALAKAPTGLGSEAVHTASSYLNTFAPHMLQNALSFISPIMTPEETAAYDEAKKYLTQGQLGAPGATRSNEGLSTAGAASPSTQITKEAAQLVLKGMIGLRRMEQDEGQSWLASGLPPSQFNNFRAQFQKQLDPNVYVFDQLTPAQRRTAIAKAKNPGAFMSAVERAEQNGVLSPPGPGQ